MKQEELELSGNRLPAELEYFLADTNPWWEDKPMRPLPSLRRWLFAPTLARLKEGLAPVTVLRGPRQVGKTTLQEHIIYHLLHQEGINPRRILRVQFDDIPPFQHTSAPILNLSWWFQENILKGSFNEWAHKGETVYLFLD